MNALLPVWWVLLGLSATGPTVKSGPYPLRLSDCEERSPVVTTLDAGQAVAVKFRMGECVLVGIAVGGKAVDGYLPAEAIAGLDEFERARRQAAPSTAKVIAPEAPGEVKPDASAKPVARLVDDAPPLPHPHAFDLSPGSQVPDFAFVDFEGKPRRLSDFAGHYLLITFWGAWFPPSVGEVAFLREAYSRFRGRGLEILGLNDDDDPRTVKPLLRAEGIVWPQATRASVKHVMYKQFRVFSLPAAILLDPKQRVVIPLEEGRHKLRGARLFDTLEKALPRF